MSDEHTIDTNQDEDKSQNKLAETLKEIMAPLFEQQRMILEAQQQQQQPRQASPPARLPTSADLGLDSDDPYAGQFTSLIRELASMKSENKGLRDQVQNLGVTTMQSQLGTEVKAALANQKVPDALHEQASAVIYAVLSSGQQTTPEAVASNFMRGVNAHSDTVRQGVAEQAAKPKPPTFRGQEFGVETPSAETMEEAHEMFAELAGDILGGATLEPLSAEG